MELDALLSLLVGVPRAVSVCGADGGDIQLARSKSGIRNGHELVTPVHERRHEAALAIQNGIVGNVAKRQCDECPQNRDHPTADRM